MNSGAPEGQGVLTPHVALLLQTPGQVVNEEEPECECNIRNITVVTCDTDTDISNG